MSIITFGLWLMTIVVALLIAAQLSWLTLAFVFEQAIARGVTCAGARGVWRGGKGGALGHGLLPC